MDRGMSSGNDYCDGDGDNDDDEYSDGDDNIDGFAHNDFDDDDGDGVQATAGRLLFCGPNDSQERGWSVIALRARWETALQSTNDTS